MSKLSPFLQQVSENLKTNGANEEEVGVVTDALENDMKLRKEQCNATDGFVWNSKTNTCDQKIDLEEVVEETVVEPVEAPVVEETVVEEDGKDIAERKVEEGYVDTSKEVPSITFGNDKEYEKMQSTYSAKELFLTDPVRDLGLNDKVSSSEEDIVDFLLRKYGGLGLEIKVNGVGTSKFIFGGKEISLGGMWTNLWNPDLNHSPQKKADVINEIVERITTAKTGKKAGDKHYFTHSQISLGGQLRVITQEEADALNAENPAYDPDFDLDTYMNTYKHAYLRAQIKGDGEGRDPGELASKMDGTYDYLLKNYAQTKKGKKVFEKINAQQSIKEPQILLNAIKLHYGDKEGFIKYVQEEQKKMIEELYLDNPDLKKFNYNTGIALDNYFSKVMRKVEVDLNLEERYGFLSNWNFGTAIAKGFDVTLPKEHATYIMTLKSQRKTDDLDALEAFLLSIPADVNPETGVKIMGKMDRDKLFSHEGGDIYGTISDQKYPYASMIINEDFDWNNLDNFKRTTGEKKFNQLVDTDGVPLKRGETVGADGVIMKGGLRVIKPFDENGNPNYRMVSNINAKSRLISINEITDFVKMKDTWRGVQLVSQIMKVDDLRDLEEKLTDPGLGFIDKDGSLNITSKNYSQALGDQTFRLITSALTFGMGSMVMETAGIIEQALQEKVTEIYGSDFEGFSPEKQARKMMEILDQHPELVRSAFQGGGINAALDMFSTAIFFGLGSTASKAVVNNLDDLLMFVVRGEIKQAYKVLAQSGKSLLTSTVTEMVTEGLQEFNTSIAVKGYDWDSYDFNSDGLPAIQQSMLTAFLTTPILGAGSGSIKAFKSSFKTAIARAKSPENILVMCKARREQLSKDYKNGFMIDKNGKEVKFTEKDYENALITITGAEQMFTPLDISLTDKDKVAELYDASMEHVQETEKLKLLGDREKELKKLYGPDYKEELGFKELEHERAILNKNIDEAIKKKLIIKHTDYYLTEGIDLAAEINKDYNDVIDVEILDAEDASGYLLTFLPESIRNSPEVKDQLKKILDGDANAFIMTIGDMLAIDPNYKGKGIAIAINDNITNNIKNSKGDNITASNAIHHEFEHLLFSLKYPGAEGTATLKEFRNKIDNILSTSKSPEMKLIHDFIKQRMIDYKKIGTDLDGRVGVEEYLAAFGDACKSLKFKTDNLGVDFAVNFDKIQAEFKNLIHPNESGKTGNWTLGNTFDFLSEFESANEQNIQPIVFLDEDGNVQMLDYNNSVLFNLSENVESMNDSDSFNGNKQSIVQSEEVALYRETVNTIYPKRQAMSKEARSADIVRVNEDLAEKIIKAQKEGRKELEAKLRNDLIWNNWGGFEDLLSEWRTNEGLDLIPGNRDQFIGKALEQFVKATQNYNPKVNDSFYAYYFGIGVAKKRLADIYDGLNKVFTQPIDPTNDTPGMTSEEISTYQSDEIDAGTVIEEFNERSALREAMSEVLGFEVDGKMYDNFISSVSEKLGDYDFATIFDPNASQDIRNMGMSLWKNLKNVSQADLEAKFYKDGKPSQQYIDLITSTIDVFYNQMSTKDLQAFLADDAGTFIDVIEGRQNVEDYLAAKGRDQAKNKYAGNSITSKKELTPELKAILVEKLLQTNKIAKLKAEGKTKQEIAKIIRADMMIERTFKNYASILTNDAFMQVVNSDAFRDANGVTNSQIAQAGLLLDKGIDVKFQLEGETYQILSDGMNSNKFQQDVYKLLTYGESVYKIEDEGSWKETLELLDLRGKKMGLDEGVIKFVSSLFDKGFVMDAGASMFQNNITANTNVPEDIKTTRTPISKNVKGKNAMYDNAVIMTKVFGKQFMETVGYEFLGFRNTSSVLQVGKDGSEFAERFLTMSDGVKDVDLSPEMEKALRDFRPMNIMGGSKQNFTHQKDNIFLKLKSILEKNITREQKLQEINDSGLADEIKNANKANIFIMTEIITKFKEAAVDGSIDEKAMLEMFKMGGLVMGFRSFSMLSGFHCIDGVQDYSRVNSRGNKVSGWKGEHLASISHINSEVVDLIYRYKKDKTVDFDGELGVLLSEYGQILGNKADFDVLDKANPTNPTSTFRGNLMNVPGYTNANGDNLKVIQAEILLEQQTKKRVVNQKKKSQAKVNIRNSIASGKISQGASVLDFDETLADGKNFIYAIKGKERIKIPSNEFHEKVEYFTKKGYEFNFDDFVNVRDAEKGPYFEKLKKLVDKYGTESIYILTARQPGAAVAIQTWLKQNGVDLDIGNINGLGITDETGKTKTVTGQDKADWIEENLIFNGFDDILFADDGEKNVQAVIEMLNEYKDIVNRSKVVQVKPDVKYSVETTDEEAKRNFVVLDPEGNMDLNKTFNKIIEIESGVEAYKTYSEAEGKIRGKGNKNLWDILVPASTYDLEQFTYRYLGKGKVGDNQKRFFEDMLFKPFADATVLINRERQRITEGQRELIKKLPKINKSLKDKIKTKEGKETFWTKEHAIRVWLWNDRKMATAKDLGLSQTTFDMLVEEVENDQNLINFANELGILSDQSEGYVKPSEYWTVEGVAQDLQRITSEGGRSKYLQTWKHNVEILFSKENLSKIESIYGAKHVEALKDMLYRMEYGSNKNKSGRIETAWNNWVNNSVGAVMFFNTRSAVLQTISAANYIDYGDNNMLEAGKRILNIKQFGKDLQYIFFSDYLKQRRSGNQRGINESELSAAVEKGGPKAAVAWLLEKGFLPTQIADSFAIASGGATFYRSKVLAYEKQGMSTKEAEKQAFTDFLERTESNQQSSRADKISQQQAGGLGRILLAFGNTPMQYNRIIMKSVQDLKNNRGKAIENIGKIAYYGAVQNAIFVTLQTALFSAFGEDDDQWDTKTERAANGMIDTLLKGMGLQGVMISTIKNSYMMWQKQRKKGFNADHAYTILQFANMSPTIGSKLRKLYSATQSEKFNQDLIDKMGFDINSPALNAIANVISATTNIPTDRALQKVQNILLAADSETEAQDLVALLLGWNPWDLGIDSEAKKTKQELKKDAEETSFIETKPIEIQKEKKNKEKQKEEKKEGKIVLCSFNTQNGRCKTPVEKGNSRCTIHEKVPQREDGKKTRCKHIKKSKKRCGVTTANESGYCYYHD